MKESVSSIKVGEPDVKPAKQSLTIKEAAHLVGVSTRTLYRLINAGLFPKQRKIGKSSRWDRSEVLGYWEARAAA